MIKTDRAVLIHIVFLKFHDRNSEVFLSSVNFHPFYSNDRRFISKWGLHVFERHVNCQAYSNDRS